MTISRKMNGTTLEISVSGSLDTLTSPLLAAELEKGLDGAETLIWNFADLDYISSAGFRVLLVARDMLDNPDKFKVVHANDMVQTAFILTGQGDVLMDE